MKRFEYKTYDIHLKNSIFKNRKVKKEELDKVLLKMGQEGWELVTSVNSLTNGWTSNIVLIFKRSRD